ncbi:unnamed protein product [Arabidopsis halleri]
MPDWLSLARWVPALNLSLGFSALCLDTDIIRLVLIEERVMVPLYAFLLNSKSMGWFPGIGKEGSPCLKAQEGTCCYLVKELDPLSSPAAALQIVLFPGRILELLPQQVQVVN